MRSAARCQHHQPDRQWNTGAGFGGSAGLRRRFICVSWQGVRVYAGYRGERVRWPGVRGWLLLRRGLLGNLPDMRTGRQ